MFRLLGLALLLAASLSAQVTAFVQWATDTARAQAAQRNSIISQIHTVSDAELRKSQVSTVMYTLLGQLPTYAGPLNAQVTGSIDRGAYRIEKILFESLPGIKVSANLYVPAGTGPFPAILFQIGHFQNGKAAEQLSASNLALKGFVVITFDPIGQAERLQGYDPNTGTSLAGWGVPQHFMAGAQSVLMGQSYARYEIFDAKRALDYLVSRPEVDATRIGATGCSGGGTLTTFVSALDSRVKVAAPACYINSFSVLLPQGLGDSEQSWPNFVSSGLDETDFVELFSPRPFLILSTQDDYFTPAGAKVVYDEAKAWYGLYQASDRVQWFVGPGPHGTPLEDRQAIYSWMIQWLKNGVGDATEAAVTLLPDSDLNVTPNGYVGGSDIYQVIRQTPVQRGTLDQMLTYVRQLIQYTPQSSPPSLGSLVDHGSYMAQPFTFSPEPGFTVSAEYLFTNSPNQKPAAVYFETSGFESAAAVQLAQSGSVVLDLMPRALPRTDFGGYTGEVIPAELAWLVGRNLPGMRAKDILQSLDLLLTRSDVDPAKVSLYANGVHGVAALLAAATDTRIGTVVLDHTPSSFLPALNSPVHIDLHSALLPGFLTQQWDLFNLVSALGRRKILWTNPTDWLGNVVPSQTLAPRLTASVTAKGLQGSQYFVDVTFTNSGPGTALGVSLESLIFRTLSGSGTVTAATTLPVSLSDIPSGTSQTAHLYLNAPASVLRFSISESGSLHNGVGAGLTYSLSQGVIR